MTKKVLRDGESNPGLPRDRRGYSPLYYRGVIFQPFLLVHKPITDNLGSIKCQTSKNGQNWSKCDERLLRRLNDGRGRGEE